MENQKQAELQVEISDWVKSTIVQCIREALEERIAQFKEQIKLSTYTCLPFLKGDFICTCLDEKFPSNNSLAIPIKRGGWEGRLIVDQTSKIVCSVISKKRLLELRKTAFNKKVPHYTVLFSAVLNGDLNGKNKQMSLFEGFPFTDEMLAKEYDKHLGWIVQLNESYRYCIFCYEIRNQELFSCELVFLDKDLDYVESISLNEYIGLDFSKLSSMSESQVSSNNANIIDDESQTLHTSRVKLKIKQAQ